MAFDGLAEVMAFFVSSAVNSGASFLFNLQLSRFDIRFALQLRVLLTAGTYCLHSLLAIFFALVSVPVGNVIPWFDGV